MVRRVPGAVSVRSTTVMSTLAPAKRWRSSLVAMSSGAASGGVAGVVPFTHRCTSVPFR